MRGFSTVSDNGAAADNRRHAAVVQVPAVADPQGDGEAVDIGIVEHRGAADVARSMPMSKFGDGRHISPPPT